MRVTRLRASPRHGGQGGFWIFRYRSTAGAPRRGGGVYHTSEYKVPVHHDISNRMISGEGSDTVTSLILSGHGLRSNQRNELFKGKCKNNIDFPS